MIYALDPRTGWKIRAAPGLEGVCPVCGEALLPRCGALVTRHWAHRPGGACDSSSRETPWHLQWKSRFPEDSVEVPIEQDGTIHIADVRLPNRTTIEFQHSPISAEEIHQREFIYGRKLIWIFDARSLGGRRILYPPRPGKPRWTFRWKHPWKTIGLTQRRVLLDLGYPQRDELEELPWHIDASAHRLFALGKLYLEKGPPYGGWGQMISREDFFSQFGFHSPPPP